MTAVLPRESLSRARDGRMYTAISRARDGRMYTAISRADNGPDAAAVPLHSRCYA
jgi:hypothetical protein